METTKRRVRTPKKKYPEFELPPLIVGCVQDYLGRAGVDALTAQQRRAITSMAQDAASDIGGVLYDDSENPAQDPAEG